MKKVLTAILLAAPMLACNAAPGATGAGLWQGFTTPPDNARPLVRWWWFGPAVEQGELAREIAAMRAGGFGGFEIQPVYPLTLDEPAGPIHNLQFLSDEFLRDVGFAAATARAQGLRADVTLGSGWPYGGPQVPVTQASSQIRMIRVALAAGADSAALPAIGAGERLLAVFLADGAGTQAFSFDPSAPRVSVAPSAQPRSLLVFLQSRTGQQVKRPGLGGEGFVLDHMNAVAVRQYLDSVGQKLVNAFAGNPPYSVFSDSLEVYGADWTDDLFDQFRRRRGYDLAPHLPALFLDEPSAPAIRHDWALTLSELVDERYLAVGQAWAAAHNTRFRAQVYGTPPVTLSSNRLVGLAEGEGAPWRQFTTSRWASSANHLYGQAVTSAESWTWLHAQPFRATPLDIKAEADTLLLQGVNQFVAHGWPYSPPQAGEPGWAFYAAAVFNAHNPWWPVMADVNAYLQRLSHLLRQGEPVADVAILLPTDDAFARIVPGKATVSDQMRELVSDKLTQQVLDAGYSFDYVDGAGLDAPGFRHKILVLPNVTRIAPAVYRRVAAFAQRGGVVIAAGGMPQMGAGFLEAEAQAREVRAISSRLFARGGRARQVPEEDVGMALRAALAPDLSGGVPALGFVHRKLGDGDLYFVANTSNQPVKASLSFRAGAAHAQWWDPRSGQAHGWKAGEAVALAPYESRVFVFGAAASAPEIASAVFSTQQMDLSQGWTVTFGGAAAPRPVSAPHSWTDDAPTRFYSGEAIYRRTLTLSAAQVSAGELTLKFGSGMPLPAPERQLGTSALIDSPVREAAEIFVNGTRAGSVWAPPYQLDLAPYLHAGENRLEIRVTNTAINALAGRSPTDYRLLNLRYGERFTPPRGALTPLPSGLLQPISLGSAQ